MTTVTLSCTSADCYVTSDDADITTGSTTAWLGGTSGDDVDVRNWIPFAVNLSRYTKILTATLRLVASSGSPGNTLSALFGCEAADSPSTPASKADLMARTQTGAASLALPGFNAGDEFTFNITTAVQNILNRSGWNPGQTMAVLIVGQPNGSNNRSIATFEYATYAEPKIDLTYSKFFPRNSSVI